MAQKFVYPKTETELKNIQDQMYHISKEAYEQRKRPAFKSLMEIISSETVILTAIHNIKANKGSKTPGSDNKTIDEDILQLDYHTVVKNIQLSLKQYKPKPIRRVWIPKEGSKEQRPLGIPSIEDRIIQECIRIVIEPIFEGQFFIHSYGFRPMREAGMAMQRVTNIVHDTGYHWVVEGDISKFFDKVDHRILLKRMWSMGIRDRRLLMIIKQMLEAGIVGESSKNLLGTPQGGILSPLLANIYLDAFDQWVTKQWENKRTNHQYLRRSSYTTALNKTNLHPAYLIRYADDWVLITKSKELALMWKHRISKFLKDVLKLELSKTKTVITNLRKKYIKFLGFEYKVVKGKGRFGYITRTIPNREKLKGKMKSLRKSIRKINYVPKKRVVIHQINLVNSQIRGIVNYYNSATWVNKALSKYQRSLTLLAFHKLKDFGVQWVPANQVNNLTSIHENYITSLPTIEFEGMKVGVSTLLFSKWEKAPFKNQKETPFSVEGRQLYEKRTKKKSIKVRADELLSIAHSKFIAIGTANGLYNFEFLLNKAYAFNRDKGKCRVCGNEMDKASIYIHHVNPRLPLNLVNKVSNLATMHDFCHKMIHTSEDFSHLKPKTWEKVKFFREKLGRK